jgi:predicted metal-binding membrane protein
MIVRKDTPDLVERDRQIVVVSLAALTLLAWILLVGSKPGRLFLIPPRDARELLLQVGLWSTIVIGVMLPNVIPMALLYARMTRRQGLIDQPLGATALFVAGYLLVWFAFGVGATALAWLLLSEAWLRPGLLHARPALAGGLLLAVGIYQWLPFKAFCLHHCRSLLHFFSYHWRRGQRGALQMGIVHGLYCAGCCGMLLLLLFVVGVINLPYIAALALYVLAERMLPFGPALSRISGTILIIGGFTLLW